MSQIDTVRTVKERIHREDVAEAESKVQNMTLD